MDAPERERHEATVNTPMDRRGFFRKGACVGAATWALAKTTRNGPAVAIAEEQRPSAPLAAEEARHYDKLETGAVRCRLEPRECEIGNGERGFCGVRENRAGKYYSLTYGRPCAIRVAHIEETFMHVLPGAKALNVGTAGCNLQCQFCNTFHISQARPEDTTNEALTPEQLVERAKAEGCSVICFTDNEPVVCFEYMMDTAKAARAAGLKTTCHTAGHLHPEPATELAGVLEAVCVDLKAATNEVHEKLTMVKLDPVLDTLKHFAKLGLHMEVASPLLPKYNDPPEFATAAAQYILSAGGAEVPWMLMRYFPSYNMLTGIATPLSMMRETLEVGQTTGLKHVYLCNVRTDDGQNVTCPKCGETCVKREAGEVECTWTKPGACPKCNTKIPGVWG